MRAAFALFFLLFVSYAAELNQTLIDANQSLYRDLLRKIERIPVKNEEIELQKALLQKILALPLHPKPPAIKLPKKIATSDDFAKILEDFIDVSLELRHLRQREEQNEEFLKNIERRITKIADTNASLTLQLQYALYKKLDRTLRQKERDLHAQKSRIEDMIRTSLPHVNFDVASIRQEAKELRSRLLKLQKEIESLELDKERYEILGKKERVEAIEKRIRKLQAQKERTLRSLLVNRLLLFFFELRSKDKNLFATQKEILELAKRADPDLTLPLDSLLQSMEKRYLGTATTLQGWTLLNIKLTLQKMWQELNEPLFTLGKTPVSGLKIALALLAMILGFIVGAIYKRTLKRIRSSISESTKTLLSNLGYYFFVLLGFFLSLNILGVNLSSLTIIAGALSVGIGFGLQNIVSNFVSGLILMFERSVKIGDYIELDQNLRGHVSDIRMRSTTITTNSNIDIIIPNQEFIQNRVINWTMNDKIRRFEIPFGVAYGSDIDKVRRVILEAVKKSGFEDIYEDPPYRITRVIMTGMGESSVDFELFVWIRGKEILYPKRTISRFLELIYKTLYKEGIEIPFPQRDIHIRSIDKEIPIVLK